MSNSKAEIAIRDSGFVGQLRSTESVDAFGRPSHTLFSFDLSDRTRDWHRVEKCLGHLSQSTLSFVQVVYVEAPLVFAI